MAQHTLPVNQQNKTDGLLQKHSWKRPMRRKMSGIANIVNEHLGGGKKETFNFPVF